MFLKLMLVCYVVAVCTAKDAPKHNSDDDHRPKSSQSFVRYDKSDQPGIANDTDQHGDDEYAYPAYKFSYSVNDQETMDVKEQSEERDGDDVIGHYSLLQPDGNTRTVHYKVNGKSGFIPIVRITSPDHHEQVTDPLNNKLKSLV